jgi:arylformamidase
MASWNEPEELISASHKVRLIMNMPCFKAVYDISLPLGETATYPGDTPYSREMVSEIASGSDYDLSTLILSSHAGTHLDAPAHFIAGGKTLDLYPLERFLLPAHVVSIDDDVSITQYALKAVDIDEGEALLFKTKNSLRGLSRQSKFTEDFVYLSKDAAQFCLDLGVSMVGIDYLSIDKFGNDQSPIHNLLLQNDVLILEGIDLIDVPAGEYTLFCAPIRVSGAEAAPTRAILAR